MLIDRKDPRAVEETFSVSEHMLYAAPLSDVEAARKADVIGGVWAASGSGCSVLAHDIEHRIASVIYDGAVTSAYGSLWNLVLLPTPLIEIEDIEHDVVLPAQPPSRVRRVVGRVVRRTHVWPGLALSDADIETVGAGLGDA